MKFIVRYDYQISQRHILTESAQDIGEVWANILHNVYAALVGAYGFSAAKVDATGTAGNVVFLHLFIDALPLQPCSPTCKALHSSHVVLR